MTAKRFLRYRKRKAPRRAKPAVKPRVNAIPSRSARTGFGTVKSNSAEIKNIALRATVAAARANRAAIPVTLPSLKFGKIDP